MKIFLDTAEIDEIHSAARWGVLDGVTTNPTLFAKVGGSYDDVLKQICQITPGPVSAEVIAEDVEGMLREGRHFAKLAPNIVVKVAISEVGLEAIARLAHEGICCRPLWGASMTLMSMAWTPCANWSPWSGPTTSMPRCWLRRSGTRAT